MYPDRRQRGVGLPLAIFIITVLALIVATMAQLQVAGANAVSLQLQSQRAFLAAESGAQLAVAQVLGAGNCTAVAAAVPGAGTFTATGLEGCRATLSCSASTPVAGPAGTLQYFQLTSTGTCAMGDGSVAQRIVEVRVQ